MTVFLSWFVQLGSVIRRWLYQHGWLRSFAAAKPVISVGNIGFGGTGKTPTVLALCRALKAHGLNPVVLTRGYGRKYSQPTQLVAPTDAATQVGDEPLLLARAGERVVVDADRARAAKWACTNLQPDVLVLDDGFSHHRLKRQFDLVLLGAQHLRFWHRRREPRWALRHAHAVATLEPTIAHPPPGLYSFVRSVIDVKWQNRTEPAASLRGRHVTAAAAIAHPERFVATLTSAGAIVDTWHAFHDHHPFPPDFLSTQSTTVAITEKDAVKLPALPDNVAVVRIGVILPDALVSQILAAIGHA